MFLRDEPGLFAFHLGFDEAHEIGSIVVRVFLGLPLLREVLDEGRRQVQFLLPDGCPSWEAERLHIDELVGEPQRGQHQRLVQHFDRRQVLHVAQDELGDADAARSRMASRSNA